MYLWTNLFVFIFVVGKVSSLYKRWLPDTNFDNPKNWNVKRVPCGNDVTIIAEDSPAVYMQVNTTIKELVLPKNGEIILGKNAQLVFTNSPVAGCPDAGGDVEFTAVHPKPWLNPTNWCPTATERGNCQELILDVEKVPCNYDDVVFPRDRSYFVDLSNNLPDIKVKSLKISGSSFSTSTLTSYFSSSAGQRMFKLPTDGSGAGKIEVTRRECTAVSGCACGNDRPEIAKMICAHVEKTCRRPRCKETLQPIGACCRMCGAILNVTMGYGFDLSSFKSVLKNRFFSNGTTRDLKHSTSVMSDGWVQVVLTDLTGQKSSSLAKMILDDIRKDVADGGHTYAADSVRLSLSTGPAHSAYGSSDSMSGGSIAGIVFGCLIGVILIILIIVFVVFRRQGRDLPVPKMPSMPSMPAMPSMPRLPRRTPRATARVPPSQPQTAAHIDPGFANPLYDSSPFDDGNAMVKEMKLMSTTSEEQPTFDATNIGFNNPLYGSKTGRMFSDPAKTDETEQSPSASGKGVVAASGASPATSIVTFDVPQHEGNDSTI